jgi:hypothetical protein
VTALAILAMTGCAGRLGNVRVAPAPCCAVTLDQTSLQYLGVGGWLIRHRGAALLTAPFYSNPGLVRVGLGWIHADTVRIQRFLPDVSDVESILAGHGHYDHLMDVPHVASRAPRATVYASETARHQLAAAGLSKQRVVRLNEAAGDATTPGQWVWVSDGRMRFMALHADHAPHAFGIELYEGFRERTPGFAPYWAGNWRTGRTFAFLIDLLDEDGGIALRIHYADAASKPPNGFVPPEVLAERSVDLAILCPPGFEQVDDYPEGILANVRPLYALLGHWEDFFRPQSDLRVVPTLDLPKFVQRLSASGVPDLAWSIPEPGRVYAWPFGGGQGWVGTEHGS